MSWKDVIKMPPIKNPIVDRKPKNDNLSMKDYEKLFDRALKKKISMFYEALNWSFPIEKEYTLERFF